MGEEKRHQMMQNLFGDQSEEEEIDSEHESNPQPNYASVNKYSIHPFSYIYYILFSILSFGFVASLYVGFFSS
jgi:hypothetical protein